MNSTQQKQRVITLENFFQNPFVANIKKTRQNLLLSMKSSKSFKRLVLIFQTCQKPRCFPPTFINLGLIWRLNFQWICRQHYVRFFFFLNYLPMWFSPILPVQSTPTPVGLMKSKLSYELICEMIEVNEAIKTGHKSGKQSKLGSVQTEDVTQRK